MRCPDCNKFVAYDTDQDPEVENMEVDEEGTVSVTVRIVNACADCGTELTEGTIEMEGDLTTEVEAHRVACHCDSEGNETEPMELDVEEGEITRTSRSEGKGRGTRTFYGAEVEAIVKCGCGRMVDETGNVVEGEFTCSVTMSDDLQASSMDSCC